MKFDWKLAVAFAGLALPLFLVACGGGNDRPATGQPPAASITSPAAGATFKAGDTLAFAGTGTDPEDGALAGNRLTWWVDLHHDTHTHPLLLDTVGANGSVAIPVRGETSDNIFYRFHLRATDSAGLTNEVTRDVLPQKAQLTLATVPAGLALTLDGQSIASTPNMLTGVVGIERDLGAAAQNFNGRRYVFARWSDGGAASHTIATPSANTTYTATFTDSGPVSNIAPMVALSGTPATGTTGVQITLAATATDTDDRVTKVEFFDGATKLGEDLGSPYTLAWTPATTGAHSITARATDNFGLATTSAAVVVTVAAPGGADTQAPVATLTAPAAFATGLTGVLTLSATATDNVAVTGLEIQLDSTQVGLSGTTGAHSVTVDSNAYTSGQHVVRARARDAADNLSPWVSRTVQFGGSRVVPAGFTRNETWVTGLSSATAFAQAPDGRFFAAQQGGALRVVTAAGALLPTPMLSLTVDSNGERGLIGVTLHPDFASNGFVYVYYTTAESGTHNRVSRFTVSGNAAGSELQIANLPGLSSAQNHNGGAMHFGIDGKLYVAVGDNNNSANAPLLTSVFGKMLRFNDDGTFPSDNPFVASTTGQAQAIWARGLRNPFTFAIQPGSGRIHINDVGEGTWEEVNLGVQGANYGWPASEGPDNVTERVTGPLFAYKHSDASPLGSGPGGFLKGFAIAGGTFYLDAAPFPAAYRNSYYFADYVSQFVGRYDWINNASYAFGAVSDSPVDMLSGSDGALYVLTRSGITRFSAP